VPFLVVVLLALGVASLLLYTSDRRSTRQEDLLVSPEAAEALRLRSLELEVAFEKIRQERFELKEADILLLEEALRLQEEYVTARLSVGTDNFRQQSLRRRLHLIRGEQLRHDSDEAEAKALGLAKSNEAAAISLLAKPLPGSRRLRRNGNSPAWLTRVDGRALIPACVALSRLRFG